MSLAILSAQGITIAQLRDAPVQELPVLHALIKDKGDFDRLSR